jgi:hypothetical protein
MAKYTLTKSYGKWSDGYYRDSVANTKYGNSSFWMDDDIISTFEQGSGVDHIKMASYLRAISNFVRILTNNDKLKVQFSTKHRSYTDGSTVTISSKIDTGDFDTTVGLALHEASHCILTDFNAVPRYMMVPDTGARKAKFDDFEDAKLFKDLVNIIEDRRIDYYVMTNAPGYYGYYKALYDTYFNAKEIDLALETNQWCQETVEHYVNHICNFSNPKRSLDSLKNLRAIWKVVDLGNIGRLQTTQEVCIVAEQVFDMIKDAVAEAKADKEDENGNGNDQSDVNEDQEQEQEKESNPTNGSNDDMGGMDAEVNAEGEDGEEDDASTPSGPTRELTERQKERLRKAIDKQRDFTEGKVKKKDMKSADAEKIESVAESNTSMVEVNHGNGKCEVVVIHGMADKILENRDLISAQYSDWNTSWRSERNAKAIEAGWQLGTLLGRKLKTRDEERTLKTTRLDAGRIDKRLIAELGFGNDKIFSQSFTKTAKSSTIHISLDASGSMSGDKWANAIKTAVAIARAASMTSNIRVVIDVRGQTHGHSRNVRSRALVWVVYDSKKDNTTVLRTKFKGLEPGGATPEGLCFEAISKEIISAARGTDTYFINVSDGEPTWDSYYGSYAEAHTKMQVDRMRNEGIKVLAYFATDRDKDRAIHGSSYQAFKRMYGKDSVCIDTNDFNQLSKSINGMFVRSID